MKIVFEGLSSEYEIEKSCFCINAFVVKDKIKNRDGVDFITSNVKFLEFKDDCFAFDDILNHLNIYNNEDIIVVEDFCLDSKKQENKEKLQNISPIVEEKQTYIKFKISTIFSRVFQNVSFITEYKDYDEEININKDEKFEVFKNLKEQEQEVSFAKIEILNYDSYSDNLNFNLDIFPSGMSYKYEILKDSMYIILQGKTSSLVLFKFLKSIVYKSQNNHSCEKNFTLIINQKIYYKLKIKIF